MYSNQTLNFDVLISKLNAHAHFQISKKKLSTLTSVYEGKAYECAFPKMGMRKCTHVHFVAFFSPNVMLNLTARYLSITHVHSRGLRSLFTEDR